MPKLYGATCHWGGGGGFGAKIISRQSLFPVKCPRWGHKAVKNSRFIFLSFQRRKEAKRDKLGKVNFKHSAELRILIIDLYGSYHGACQACGIMKRMPKDAGRPLSADVQRSLVRL